MEFIQTYGAYIESQIQKLDFPKSPATLYDPLRYFMQIGGKRMRPMLTLLGAELLGIKKEKAINAALAIEVFHNFSLIHDDIMDEAPLRRGFQTVHTKWDTNTAILSGDVLLIKAYELLEQQPGDLRAMLKVFNQTAKEICEGQQLDVDYESKENLSIEDYIKMIRLKTSVLLGCALEFSAIIANSSEEDRKNMYEYGVNVGLAFQIQDDILDLYADPSKFGKQVGGDVIANKKTILYLLALQNASDEQLKQLEVLKTEENTALKIQETTKIFDDLNVKQKSLELVNHYFLKAKENLLMVSKKSNSNNSLEALADYLLTREV